MTSLQMLHFTGFLALFINFVPLIVGQQTSAVIDAGSGTNIFGFTTATPTTLFPREDPPTLPDFIVNVMKKYGADKAAEAFQSLDQLPLGLIMKILLVEVDKTLALDIVAMQRYAQSSDKTLIQMIGRIVAGDKNVPKEIFAMDQKLMKFPWWVRIRQRMLNNLEKYVAAYSLVPTAAKAALNGATGGSPTKIYETPGIEESKSELAAAVAASATEPSKQEQAVAAASSSASLQTAEARPSRLSLLTPIQQQQILASLALSRATSVPNQQQPATNVNPLAW